MIMVKTTGWKELLKAIKHFPEAQLRAAQRANRRQGNRVVRTAQTNLLPNKRSGALLSATKAITKNDKRRSAVVTIIGVDKKFKSVWAGKQIIPSEYVYPFHALENQFITDAMLSEGSAYSETMRKESIKEYNNLAEVKR